MSKLKVTNNFMNEQRISKYKYKNKHNHSDQEHNHSDQEHNHSDQKHNYKQKILSNRLNNILAKLPSIADKSNISHQHGAVLIKNGIPVVWGYNKIQGLSTVHAECSVIKQFLLSKGIMPNIIRQCFYTSNKHSYREKCILCK